MRGGIVPHYVPRLLLILMASLFFLIRTLWRSNEQLRRQKSSGGQICACAVLFFLLLSAMQLLLFRPGGGNLISNSSSVWFIRKTVRKSYKVIIRSDHPAMSEYRRLAITQVAPRKAREKVEIFKKLLKALLHSADRSQPTDQTVQLGGGRGQQREDSEEHYKKKSNLVKRPQWLRKHDTLTNLPVECSFHDNRRAVLHILTYFMLWKVPTTTGSCVVI